MAETLTQAIREMVEAEDKEIGQQVALWLAAMPPLMHDWAHWFGPQPLVPADYQEQLRQQPDFQSGGTHVAGLVSYGLRPATFFEAAQGIWLLLARLSHQTQVLDQSEWPAVHRVMFERLRAQEARNEALTFWVSRQNEPSALPSLPYPLWVGQLGTTPDLPPELQEPLSRWIFAATEYVAELIPGYTVTWINADTITLTLK